MIFPPVRISDLTADAALKRSQLETSFVLFRSAVRENTNPLHWIKKNPKWALGGVVSGLAALKLTASAVKKSTWIKQLFAFTGALFLKNVLPLAANMLMAGLTSATKKKG